ncbi:MAG: pseudouridine synthase, partial [Proteobacteria bacterium]|nr:pseudouridine synthase [Pseudomonadota bacterium]
AGLVMFSADPRTRGRYQALFRERRIGKRYEAVAPALPGLEFPLVRCSRLVAGEPFFRMREIAGHANSETRIDVLQREGATWRYALEPLTGKKHQLRVHMAALGAPIANDAFYPELRERQADDLERPLQLLAQSLRFADPLSGHERVFESRMAL